MSGESFQGKYYRVLYRPIRMQIDTARRILEMPYKEYKKSESGMAEQCIYLTAINRKSNVCNNQIYCLVEMGLLRLEKRGRVKIARITDLGVRFFELVKDIENYLPEGLR